MNCQLGLTIACSTVWSSQSPRHLTAHQRKKYKTFCIDVKGCNVFTGYADQGGSFVKIIKRINNNVVLSKEDEVEVILMEKGSAFKRNR